MIARDPIAGALRVPLVAGETPPSLANRMEAHLMLRSGTYFLLAVSRCKVRAGRTATVDEVGQELVTLLTERLELPDDHFGPCRWRQGFAWFSCPECGPVVELQEHAAMWACPRHARWTPRYRVTRESPHRNANPGPNHGSRVSRAVVRAAERVSRVSADEQALVAELLRRARSSRAHSNVTDVAPADLPFAACLLDSLRDEGIWTAVASAFHTTSAFEALRTGIVAHARAYDVLRLVEEISVQVWLLMRITVWAARIRGGISPSTECFESPVEAPAQVADQLASVDPSDWLAVIDSTRADAAWCDDRWRVNAPAGQKAGYIALCVGGHATLGRRSGPNALSPSEYRCLICRNKRPVSGVTSLSQTHNQIASEWHPTKNASRTAASITQHSTVRVWWLCSTGHEWCESVIGRVKSRNGCRECSVVPRRTRTTTGDYLHSLRDALCDTRVASPHGDLTDPQWASIERYVLSAKPHAHRNHREVINGIIWAIRREAPWRSIPPRYGSPSTAVHWLRELEDTGAWDDIVAALNAHDAESAPASTGHQLVSRSSAA